jgi:hypothetical protein
MRAWYSVSLGLLLPLGAACAQGDTGALAGVGGSGSDTTSSGHGGAATTTAGTGGSSTSEATSSSSSGTSTSGGVPTTCAEAHDKAGCCNDGIAYYCKSGATTLTTEPCSGTKVCGWNSSEDYYTCVDAPGGADPSGSNPEACN